MLRLVAVGTHFTAFFRAKARFLVSYGRARYALNLQAARNLCAVAFARIFERPMEKLGDTVELHLRESREALNLQMDEQTTPLQKRDGALANEAAAERVNDIETAGFTIDISVNHDNYCAR